MTLDAQGASSKSPKESPSEEAILFLDLRMQDHFEYPPDRKASDLAWFYLFSLIASFRMANKIKRSFKFDLNKRKLV